MSKQPLVVVLVLWVAVAGLIVASPAPAHAQSRPPNIVFVLAADLGWTDLGCTGSQFYETPKLDRLARAGVRFTNAYTAGPNCAPTRAALETDRVLRSWAPGIVQPPGRPRANARAVERTARAHARVARETEGLAVGDQSSDASTK